jgi:hypothetical protein
MAIPYKRSSGLITADAVVWIGPCYYFGFVCDPDADDRTIIIYDGINATGLAIENFIADGDKTADGHSHSIPVFCATGIFADVESGATIVIYYLPLDECAGVILKPAEFRG